MGSTEMMTSAPRRAAMKSSRTRSSPIRERMSGEDEEQEEVAASGVAVKYLRKKARARSRVERASMEAAGA